MIGDIENAGKAGLYAEAEVLVKGYLLGKLFARSFWIVVPEAWVAKMLTTYFRWFTGQAIMVASCLIQLNPTVPLTVRSFAAPSGLGKLH